MNTNLKTYKFAATALCPSMPMRDFYDCTLTRTTMIPVEKINDTLESFVMKKIYQEDLAAELRNVLCGPDDTMTLTGQHFGTVVTA